MKWHRIEVDNEVFEYLKKMAEPFVDTPNSVLRRELLHRDRLTTRGTSQLAKTSDNGKKDSFPVSTPVALQQILEVVHLVKKDAFKRNDATHIVAKRHGVFPQTVNDKYGRQLGITADEFDRILAKLDMSELETLLIEKFPSHGGAIRKFLRD